MARLFISYASEDREAFVQPLVNALAKHHDVWFAPYELTLGSSLLAKISEGLQQCDFGVVVLSPAFFQKKWPRNELDGLVALETAQEKIILPIWKDVSEDDVKAFSPILAGRLAVSTADGVDHVVDMINQAVDAAARVAQFSPLDAIKARLHNVGGQIATDRNSERMLDTVEGVEKIYAAVTTCFQAITDVTASFAEGTGLVLKATRGSTMTCHQHLTIDAPFFLYCHLSYRSPVNAANTAILTLSVVYHRRDRFGLDEEERRILSEETFSPRFDAAGNVAWRSDKRNLTNVQMPAHVLDVLTTAIEKTRARASSGAQS